MKISDHLSLAEVIRSETAKRSGVSNMPTEQHLKNFKALADNIFEKIRLHFGVPIYVSSGYRSKELNAIIKGASSTSQHCKGQAIDIDMDGSLGGVTNKMVFDFIKDNLVWDQMIWEHGTDDNPDWVHVSYVVGHNRKNLLRAYRERNKTKYKLF